MTGFVICCAVIMAVALLVIGVTFAHLLAKDKREEDARQRQRERDNDEMWHRIERRVEAAQRDRAPPQDRGGRGNYDP